MFLRGIAVTALASLALLDVCQAACSPCPFQWMEHRHGCYRYFPDPLSYEDAKAQCQRHSIKGGAGGLMTVNTTEEAVFLIEYVGRILNGTTHVGYTPSFVWLAEEEAKETFESYNMIYQNTLGRRVETDGYITPCDAYDPPVAVTISRSEIGTGVSKMVPSPEVVEQKCSIYTGEGDHLNLGNFAGTCVSDPATCDSESVTWSMWLKINSSTVFNGADRYFLSVGGQTRNARGVVFLYKNSFNKFIFGARGESWTYTQRHEVSTIPVDTWFHLAAAVDLSNSQVTLYVDGKELGNYDEGTEDISLIDKCTNLILGNQNCNPSSLNIAGSAAYSNLMVFDHLLTNEQVANLYACGSLDWDLKIRSLNIDSKYTGNLRYVCTASASTGPTINWSVYHKERASWRDLGRNLTEEGFEITSTSFSPCVVQSALVIDQTHGFNAENDAVICTANSGSRNATLSIRQGRQATIGSYSNPGSSGLFVDNTGQDYYENFDKSGEKGKNGTYPFICKKRRRGP